MPSFWSHVGILAGRDSDGGFMLYEVLPHGGDHPDSVPSSNGVTVGQLQKYDDPVQYPNIALLNFHADWEALEKAIQRFRYHRSLSDIPELMVQWLAYLWGVGSTNNPLLDGTGYPSAVFVEASFGLVGVDVTPGLPSRSSCPEAIWQAAKWWHEFFEAEDKTQRQPPGGYYWIRQTAAHVVEA